MLLASGAEAKKAAAAGPAVWNQWNSLRMRVMIFISHMCCCLMQLSHLVLCLHSCLCATSIPMLQERKLKLTVSVSSAPSLCGLLRVPAVYGSSSRRWGHSSSPFSLRTGGSHLLPSAWDVVPKEAWPAKAQPVEPGASCTGWLAPTQSSSPLSKPRKDPACFRDLRRPPCL